MTPYKAFIDTFLDKISDYKLLNYEDYLVDELAVGYMKRVCTKFDKICQADLSQQDDNEYAFLSDEIDDEIIDIVTDGMVVEWLRQYVNNSDNLENILNTKDFTMYSSKNLLAEIKSLYQDEQKAFTNSMREYSYNHGDLSDRKSVV